MRLILPVLLFLAGSFPADTARAEEIPVPLRRPDTAEPAEAGGAAQIQAQDQNRVELADPPVIHREACPALLSGAILGRLAPPIKEGECGEASPVELIAIDGIPLTGKPLVTCAMAAELAQFVRSAASIARETLGEELKAVVTGPGYECRRRNRSGEGKLSEHAFANALDIASFKFSGRREISVETHWPHLTPPAEANPAEDASEAEAGPADAPKPAPPADRAQSVEAKFLTAVHGEACKRFTTVLGPDANAYHRSHFHFDLGCHGRDCKYLICE